MNRKWIAIKTNAPKEGSKVYYFSKDLGIFRGEYNYFKSVNESVCPHKFSSNHGVLDGNKVSHWMLYDHRYRDMIPLPPDYETENIDEVNIPDSQQKFNFTYEIIGDISND